MKKIAIAILGALICASSAVFAAPAENMVPVGCGCPANAPCAQSCPTPCQCTDNDPCEAKKAFMERRCCIYKEICLVESQIKQATCIDEKFFDEIYPLKICHCQEKCKLEQMECNNACKSDIKCQKEKVRDLKKQIKAKERAHKDAFMCILNDCQKKDYKKICKKMKKEHKEKKTGWCDCNCADDCETGCN